MDTHIIAYSDESCTIEIYRDYLDDIEIMDESFDVNDGSDWWYPYLDDVEEKYGNIWKRVIIYSDDLTLYRRFDRSFHYLSNSNNINQTVVPRLILFGFESLARAKPTFSSSIIIDETNLKIDNENRFKIGFDEMPIFNIRKMGYLKKEKYKQILVILNPQDSHMSFATLGEQYNRAIYLKDSADWIKMEDLIVEFNELLKMQKQISLALYKLQYRKTNSVRVLNNSSKNIQRKIDGFLDYFCNQFPLKI